MHETKRLEVHVDKGMQDGQKIYFRGDGNQQVCLFYYILYIQQNKLVNDKIKTASVVELLFQQKIALLMFFNIFANF